MILDLNKDIAQKRQPNNYICLVGDINKKIGENPDLIATICRQHNIHDVLMQMHPSQTNTPMYNRGKTRLDYALLSNNTPAPTGMRHNPYNFIYKSDHRATFIDLPLKETLSFSQPIVSPDLRAIYSDSSKVNLFINTVDSHLQCNGLYDKINSFQSTIQTNTRPWIDANIIDN